MQPVIGFGRSHLGFRAACRAQVTQGLFIHRKVAYGCAVFGRHVRDSGTIRHGKIGNAFAKKLHKFADHLVLAKHLGDMQHHISRGHAGFQGASNMHPNDIRGEHVDRLCQRGCFGLDAADTPAHAPEARNHAGVRIRADQRIWKVSAIAFQHAGGEIFEIDLMQDAATGRDQPYAFVGLHRPFHEAKALSITLHIERHVLFCGFRRAVKIHGQRVIEYHVHRHFRLGQ